MYLKVFASVLILLWILVAATNWFIDPYGMFWSPAYEGINLHKPEAGEKSRTSKAYRLETLAPSVLLVGNSRIEMGIPAESPQFGEKVTYNYGLPGISLAAQIDGATRQIRRNANLSHIVFSLDYYDFVFPPEYFDRVDEYAALATTEHDQAISQRFKELLAYFLSLDTLGNSVSTVLKQAGQHNVTTQWGTNNAQGYLPVIRYEGIKTLFNGKMAELNEKLTRRSPMPESEPRNPGIEKLKQFVAFADNKGVKVDFFVSPVHYSYLHVLHENGHWQGFLRWKQLLANHIHWEAFENITLRDFSGFNHYTLEPIDFTNPHAVPQWYWEPAHYRAELGERILNVILTDAQESEFGAVLSKHSVERIVARDAKGLLHSAPEWAKLQAFLRSP